MTEILSRNAIDTLISTMADEDAAPAAESAAGGSAVSIKDAGAPVGVKALLDAVTGEKPVPEVPRKDCRVFDFKRPEKLSKNHARSIKGQMEVLARQLGNNLASLLRFNTEVILLEVGQCNYEDIYRSSSVNLISGTFCLEDGRPGHGVLQLSTGMAFAMIERLMGGDGSPEQAVRDLTEFEKIILADVFQMVLDLYVKAMKDCSEIDGRMMQIETDERLIAKAFGMKETFVKSTFEIKFPQNKGVIVICIPFYLVKVRVISLEPPMAS